MKKVNHHPKSGCSPAHSPKEKQNEHHEIRNLLIIISLSALPYCSSLYGDFVFDDAESIVNNPIVNGKHSLGQIFFRDFWGRPIISPHSHKSYRPVTTFTFWVNYQLHGTSTFGYHAVNIFLHSIASFLIYRFTDKLEKLFGISDIAFPSAVIFATHPVHTEAVANVTGRAELLMTIFSIAALLSLSSNQKVSLSFLVFVCLATFSKEQGLMTLPIAMFLELLSKKPTVIKLGLMTMSFLLLGTCRLMINGFESAKFTKLDNPTAFIESKFYRVVNYSYIWAYHMYLLVVPANLCFDYSMGCISPISSLSDFRILSPVLILAVLIIGVRFWNECRIISFSIAMGIFAFLPSSNIFFTVGFTIAERILYFPSVGFCIFCAVALKKLSHHYKHIDLIAITLLLLAVSKIYTRSSEWKNEYSLYNSGLAVCPMNAKIHYNLGKVMGDIGLVKDAEKNYWNAIKLEPSYEQALNNLGNLLEKTGDSKTAESLLARAVTLRPNFAVAWMNLGISQMNLLKYQDSEKSLKNSLALRPNSAHCLFNLGVLYQRTNRDWLAMSTWKNSTSVDPSHTQSWTNLFVVLDHLDLCSEVIELSQYAMQNVPKESRIHMQIGSCYAKQKDFDNAEKHISTAIELNPTSALYHANLGVLFHRMNRLKEAASQYKVTLMMDSTNPIALSNLRKIEQQSYRNSTSP